MTKKRKQMTNLLIIDASGSMSPVVDEVRGGIKQVIKDVKKTMKKNPEVRTRLIVAQFHSPGAFEVLVDTVNRSELNEDMADGYQALGLTALYDAIGAGFALVEDKQDGVFVNIITDGHENSSREVDVVGVKRIIADAKKKDWTITFMGTSEQSIGEAKTWGIKAGNTAYFTAGSKRSIVKANAVRGMAMSNYSGDVVAGVAMSAEKNYVNTTSNVTLDVDAEDIVKDTHSKTNKKVKQKQSK